MRVLPVAALLTLLAPALAATPPAAACCMVPKDYPGSIGQAGQKAILLHRGTTEDLVLAVDYRIKGAGGGDAPGWFAWVVTVPSEPSAYAVVEEGVFDAVHAWAMPLVAPPPPPPAGGLLGLKGVVPRAAVEDRIEFGRRTRVGPYDIQPVRALGMEALAGLNEWLEDNGFPTEDPGHMAYFVREKFTFLAVKVVPPEREKAVSPGGLLPPLHLTFETARPYYPLKFSSRQGALDLDVYALTSKPLDYEASRGALDRIRWNGGGLEPNVAVEAGAFPAPLRTALAASAAASPGSEWFLNVIRPRGVNGDDSIRSWTEDVFLATGPLPPARWPWIAAAAAALLLGGGALLARRRSRAG